MFYEKMTTYFANKGTDIRDVEEHFSLSNTGGVYQIDTWDTSKLGGQPTMDEVNALAASTLPKIRGDRRAAYPDLAEQFDLLYHDMTAGKGDKDGEWYKTVAKVKSDNPKPE